MCLLAVQTMWTVTADTCMCIEDGACDPGVWHASTIAQHKASTPQLRSAVLSRVVTACQASDYAGVCVHAHCPPQHPGADQQPSSLCAPDHQCPVHTRVAEPAECCANTSKTIFCSIASATDLHVAIWNVMPKLDTTNSDPLYDGCPKVQPAAFATCRHAARQQEGDKNWTVFAPAAVV